MFKFNSKLIDAYIFYIYYLAKACNKEVMLANFFISILANYDLDNACWFLLLIKKEKIKLINNF